MVQQRICRHAGSAKEPVHLHQTRQHLPLESDMRHQVTLTELKVMKLKVCHPCVCIYILPFETLKISIIMHMLRRASAIKILFQICRVHYLVHANTADIDFEDDRSLLSESGSEEDKLIESNGIVEYYYYLLSVDTLKYISKDIYLYAQFKNNVVINDNMHEEDRMTAKIQLLMFYAKVNGCIMLIRLWQNEHHQSVNNYLFCKSGN